MLAVVVDRTRTAGWPAGRWRTAGGPTSDRVRPAAWVRRGWRRWRWRRWPWCPVAVVLPPNVPLDRPAGGRAPVVHLGGHPPCRPAGCSLTYPFATADSQSAIPWQAIGRMPYAMAGGGGPPGTVARAGRRPAPGSPSSEPPRCSFAPPPADVGRQPGRGAAGHARLGGDHGGRPRRHRAPTSTSRPGAPSCGVAFFTAVLGSAPARQAGAWVWDRGGHRHRPPGADRPGRLRRLRRPREPVGAGRRHRRGGGLVRAPGRGLSAVPSTAAGGAVGYHPGDVPPAPASRIRHGPGRAATPYGQVVRPWTTASPSPSAAAVATAGRGARDGRPAPPPAVPERPSAAGTAAAGGAGRPPSPPRPTPPSGWATARR